MKGVPPLCNIKNPILKLLFESIFRRDNSFNISVHYSSELTYKLVHTVENACSEFA